MGQLEILFIGLGLSMDAFAVAITSGSTIGRMKLRHAMLIASFFGAFQAIMPALGWLLGSWARNFVKDYDHWIAFVLLGVIGGKMIYESFIDEEERAGDDPLNLYVLFMLAVATSIDALAVGVSLTFLDVSILLPALEIGAITFVLSFAGAYIGKIFGHLFEKKLEVLGGLVLIGIGCKILVEHLFF